jgi:hypothetical protein
VSQAVASALGAVLILASWLSVMRTVVTPRQRSSLAARLTLRLVTGVIRLPARVARHGLREWLQDLCTPVSLLLMGSVWIVSATAGFALLAAGIQGVPFTVRGLAGFFLMRSAGAGLAAAGWLSGALMLAAFSSHLVRVTAAYSRREGPVARLAARATRPPDAEVVLADYLRSGSRDHLDGMFAEWSGWLADVQTSHLAFPAMLYLRPASDLCWAKAALIVLDCAALTEAAAPEWAPPNTRPLLTMGSRCLHLLALELGAVESPAPVSFHGREELPFGKTFRLAVEAGLPVERSEEAAGVAFLSLRLKYAPYPAAIGDQLLYHDIR